MLVGIPSFGSDPIRLVHHRGILHLMCLAKRGSFPRRIRARLFSRGAQYFIGVRWSFNLETTAKDNNNKQLLGVQSAPEFGGCLKLDPQELIFRRPRDFPVKETTQQQKPTKLLVTSGFSLTPPRKRYPSPQIGSSGIPNRNPWNPPGKAGSRPIHYSGA